MKFGEKFAGKMVPIATIIGENKYLLNLCDGFIMAFPATMFASIMSIIQTLPTTFGFGQYLPDAVNVFSDLLETLQ